MAHDEDLSLTVLQGVGLSPVVGALASIAYSRCGRTMTPNSGIDAVLENWQKDLWTISSNRLTVFAASLRWADAVKVVSDVSDLENSVAGVCRGERRRMGRQALIHEP